MEFESWPRIRKLASFAAMPNTSVRARAAGISARLIGIGCCNGINNNRAVFEVKKEIPA
jgi:hypothetical protein